MSHRTSRPRRPSPQHRWISTRSERIWVDGQYVTIHDEGFWYEGPVAEAHTGPIIEIEQYRFAANDNSSVPSMTLLGTLNTAFSATLDTTYIMIVCLENVGDAAANNNVHQFDFSVDGGAWTELTNTSGAVRMASGQPSDLSTFATKVLPTLGSSTFSGTGYYEETGGTRSGPIAWSCPDGNNTELALCMTFRSAVLSGTEEITFRFAELDQTPYGTMNVTPTVNFSTAATGINPGFLTRPRTLAF